MARYIKTPEDKIQGAIERFAAFITNRGIGGELVYKADLDKAEGKATLFISEKAWLKMRLLVDSYSKEIGWYGCGKRVQGGESHSTYMVDDILVYPQNVTSAEVDYNIEGNVKWKMDNYDDERTHRMFMHGHSHVNMGVSPSSTDKAHQMEIVDMLRPDQFYIFMIMNKSGEKYIVIYDKLTNIMYEKNDINIQIVHEDGGLLQFVEQAKEVAKEVVYVSPSQSSYYNPGYGGVSYPRYYGIDDDDCDDAVTVYGHPYRGATSYQAGSHVTSLTTTGSVGKVPTTLDTSKKKGKPKRASKYYNRGTAD